MIKLVIFHKAISEDRLMVLEKAHHCVANAKGP